VAKIDAYRCVCATVLAIIEYPLCKGVFCDAAPRRRTVTCDWYGI